MLDMCKEKDKKSIWRPTVPPLGTMGKNTTKSDIFLTVYRHAGSPLNTEFGALHRNSAFLKLHRKGTDNLVQLLSTGFLGLCLSILGCSLSWLVQLWFDCLLNKRLSWYGPSGPLRTGHINCSVPKRTVQQHHQTEKSYHITLQHRS